MATQNMAANVARTPSQGSVSSHENEKKVAPGELNAADAAVMDAIRNEANGIAADGEQTVKRDLKPRQISMIAIGGAIGTGLVIGTGSALARSGPAAVFLAYCIMGFTCFNVMCALGELSAYIPHKRGFAGHGSRFVEPAFGFATGWNYLFKYLLISPNQLVASSLVLRFWRPDLNSAIFITVFIIAIALVNFAGVAAFG